MIASKFLSRGATGLYSGFSWPTPRGAAPGAWVEVAGPLVAGMNGIHACTPNEIVNWIDDELWLVELDGEITEHEGVLAARRGRLLLRVGTWDAAAADGFTLACVLSARDHAVSALARAGDPGRAVALSQSDDYDELQAFGAAAPVADAPALDALRFVADAVELARGGRPDHYGAHPGAAARPTPGAIAANLGFVVAHAAGCAAAHEADDPSAYQGGFDAERERQRAWLSERLRLDGFLSEPAAGVARLSAAGAEAW